MCRKWLAPLCRKVTALTVDLEFVQVTVSPAHGGLNDLVQVSKGQVVRDPQPPPDPRLYVEQLDMQLIDVLDRFSSRW